MARWLYAPLGGLLVLAAAERPAAAKAAEDDWLRTLQADMRADIAGGKPLVVQVHVPLCDNSIIRCGGRGLGDGDDLRRNLYWATTEGLAGWMGRRGSGWTQELRTTGAALGEPRVLEIRVWRRELPVPRAWAGPGMPATFVVRLVGFAWRGAAIDAALSAYLADLFGSRARVLTLPGSAFAPRTIVEAGGAARVVAWVGHNRLMDAGPNWDELQRSQDRSFRKGTLAVACYSADYLRPTVVDPSRVPLLMTASLVMASSAALEGGLMAFLSGGDLSEIRTGGASGYAAGQRRPVERVRSAFTNPSDRRW
jgi:hypothetical protein